MIRVPSKFVSQAQIKFFFAVDEKLSKYQVSKIHKMTRGIEYSSYPKHKK